jgi:O-antigen/teichoic acid export membrane protein
MLNMGVKKAVYTCCPDLLHPLLNRIEASETGYRLAKGVFWSMAGTVLSRGMMFAASVLVARILGKTIYGELGIIHSTINMFGVFAGFELGLTATKHVAEFRDNDPERAGRIISLSWLVAVVTGSLMALVLFIFAPWLAGNTLNAPHLTVSLRISAFILFINALNSAQTGALSGLEAFKAIAHVNLVVGFLSFPLVLGGAYVGGLNGVVWGLLISFGLNWLLNHLALRKEANRHNINLTFGCCTSEFPVLWKFSLPAVLSGSMVGPVRWACSAMLVNQPGGYSEMGIFTAAIIFQSLILFVCGMLNQPLLSMLSNAGPSANNSLGTANILSSWILGVAFAIPMLCFPEIAQVLFGKEYDTQVFAVTFSLVAFCTAVITFKTGLARVLAINSLLWWGLLSNAIWAIILISCTLFLVRWKSPGLAASFVIAYVLNTVILVPLYHFRKLVPKRTLLSTESSLIWSILIGLLLLNIFNVSLWFRSIIFVPCLLLSFYAFKKLMEPMLSQRSC